MVLELEHFVYSLYPNRGYGVTAATPKLDKQRWRAYSAPFPVDYAELQKLGRAYSLQILEEYVVFSFFSAEARDEYNRSGIFSHNIIIPISVFVNYHAPFLPLISSFITDINTEGDIPPLRINPENLTIPLEPDLLNRIRPSILERIIGCILGGSTAAIVCPEVTTLEMVHFMSAITQLLPDDIKPVSFITAPLGRAFRQDRDDSSYKLKLVQNRSIAMTGTGEYIDLTEDINLPASQTFQGRAAHHLIDSFLHGGYESLKDLFKLWDRESEKSNGNVSKVRYFVQDFEVTNGQISFDDVLAMWKRGQKQEAKSYARTIIDKRAWRNIYEFTQLCTFILENSQAESIKDDVEFIVGETNNLNTGEKTQLFDNLIKNLPKLRGIISSSKLNHKNPLPTAIKDASNAPPISSLVAGVKNYDDYKTVSGKILTASLDDMNSFGNSLGYLLSRTREKYGEKILDFVLFLIAEYPDKKSAVIKELVKEDFIPAELISSIPSEFRQQAITRSSQTIELIRTLS